jgi:tetratricopeptide (TPR) repeat protein
VLKDITTTCPRCGHEIVLAVAAPQPGSGADHAISTFCRKCKARIIAVTQSDGTVQLEIGEGDDFGPAATLQMAFGLADVVRIPFALWQPRGEEIGEFKHRPQWTEALHQALRVAQARPRPLSRPRRIFVSYRWQGDQADAWVAMLARELMARGNLVVFDRETHLEAQSPSVPELVARIADCHVFLAVLDPAYIERVAAVESESINEGWVTDELHTALAFAGKGILTLLGLLREGDRLPPAFREFAPGQAGNTFDVRDPSDLLPILDNFFVQFGVSPQGEAATQAAAALHESGRAFDEGDRPKALEQADRACRLMPELADGYAQRARIGYRMGLSAESLRDARRAFQIDPTRDEMLIFAAASANNLTEWHEAARFGSVALERNRKQANAHYLVGKALTELDQVDAALAHFHIARALKLGLKSLYTDAGLASRRAGNPVRGLEWYRQGLERAAEDAVLLANATAAAIEAGQAVDAYHLLKLLAELHPDSRDIGLLTSTLARWRQEDAPPPILSRLVARPPAIGVVTCSKCAAHVPLTEEHQMLCAGCGAVVPQSIDPCLCCGAAGKVFPALGEHSICPYCGVGALHYAGPLPTGLQRVSDAFNLDGE